MTLTMKMTDYLCQFKEDTPQWLKNYTPGTIVPLKDLLASRTLYYPGSWFDGQPLETLNRAQAAHCFIYVDGNYTLVDIKKELCGRFTRIYGYAEIGSWDYSEADFWPNGRGSLGTPLGLENDKVFAHAVVFQRLPGFDETHGSERFVLLFVRADGIETYQNLFTGKGHNARPWALVLQDHGFGGNYDRFGKGGLMETIADEARSYPQFTLVADNTTPWRMLGSSVPDVDYVEGGMHRNRRRLFRRG